LSLSKPSPSAGAASRNTDRYWIEFGDKPAATAYKLKSKPKNNREDAFREVSDCAEALIAMKAIKPACNPEPKK